jgi:hypothetical protein
MRAVVVYESMYGNTRQVAVAIGAGLAPAFEVRVVPVGEAGPDILYGVDLLIVGGPTHMHGMSRAATRKAAVEAAAKPGSGLTAEPGAAGPGLREWFGDLGRYPATVKAAAFDTRVHGPAALTGQASKAVARRLRAHGFAMIARPESFLVTGQGQLEPHEADLAFAWAGKLAKTLAPASSGSQPNAA